MTFSQTAKMTIEWYKNFYEKQTNIAEFTNNQIDEYTKILKINKII